MFQSFVLTEHYCRSVNPAQSTNSTLRNWTL